MLFYLLRQIMYLVRRKSIYSRSSSMLSRILYVTNEHFRYLISQRQFYCSIQHKHSTEEKRVE